MRTKQFWLDTAERAIKTFAQVILSILAVDAVIWEIDWQQGFGIAATATVASILSSIASEPVNQRSSASLMADRGKASE